MRNKNLNFNLVSRGRQQIRIIDEVPDLLLEKISTNGMQIISLPPLPKIPKDETTQEFQSEYEIALIADEDYLAEYELGQNENKDAQYFEKIERKLRDKIRLKLDLGPLEKLFQVQQSGQEKTILIQFMNFLPWSQFQGKKKNIQIIKYKLCSCLKIV